MDKISLILTGLLMVALVVIIAPNILVMNRGKVLRNIAIWLAVFFSLALIYKNFGPGSKAPMFNLPAGIQLGSQPEQNGTIKAPDSFQMPENNPEKPL